MTSEATGQVELTQGRLILIRDKGLLAHWLDGQIVLPGTPLELKLRNGQWLKGYYYWSAQEGRWPALRVPLGAAMGEVEAPDGPATTPAAVLALHPDAVLRWPDGTPTGVG